MNIDPDKNYKRPATGEVFSGEQILALLEIAPSKDMEAIILMSIVPTDEPVTRPFSKYGL